MTVGLKVGNVINEIGSPDFFHAFFSTIAARLEPNWGARFPVLMNGLYSGEVGEADAAHALSELATVEDELAAFMPDQIVWDFEDQSKSPPWGPNIAPTITDLSNYFVTSTGRDLIPLLREALAYLQRQGGVGRIVNY